MSHNKWKRGIQNYKQKEVPEIKEDSNIQIKRTPTLCSRKIGHGVLHTLLERISCRVVWEGKDLSSRFLTACSMPATSEAMAMLHSAVR